MPNALEQKQDGKPSRPPARLIWGLFVAILLDTALQTLWKRAALNLPEDALSNPAGILNAVMHQPLFLVVGALFIAQMINWLEVLGDADVSYALPITALSYVSVAAVSAIWLGEAITPARIAGMALIMMGVVVISRTEHNTLMPPGPL